MHIYVYEVCICTFLVLSVTEPRFLSSHMTGQLHAALTVFQVFVLVFDFVLLLLILIFPLEIISNILNRCNNKNISKCIHILRLILSYR